MAEILGIGDEEDAGSEDEKTGVCGGEDVVRMGAREDCQKWRPEEADAEGGGRVSADVFAISELVYDIFESEGQGPRPSEGGWKVVTEERGVSEYSFN